MAQWTLRAFLSLVLALTGACQTASKSPIYLIKLERGDTLAAIAIKYDTTWQSIIALNDIQDAADLTVGRIIRVSPGPGGRVADESSLARRAPLKSHLKNRAQQSKSSALDGDGSIPELDLIPDEELDENASNPSRRRGGLLFGGGASRGRLKWPVAGELSSLYGKRGSGFHGGLDIRAPRGTKVMAAATGKVIFAGRKRGYGKIVILQHQSFTTYYAHLNTIGVSTGEQVGTGDVLGSVGATGNASGNHLHFEVRDRRGVTFDPLDVLSKEELLSST